MVNRRIIGMDDNGYSGVCDPTDTIVGVPGASSTLPPGIGVNSILGAVSTAYARSDHTHASSVQRTRLAIASGGLATWTFTTPYATPPIVTYGVENVSGATQPYVVNIVGQPTTTSVTFQVFKATTATVSILGANVNVFGAAAAGTYIHCWAALATS